MTRIRSCLVVVLQRPSGLAGRFAALSIPLLTFQMGQSAACQSLDAAGGASRRRANAVACPFRNNREHRMWCAMRAKHG